VTWLQARLTAGSPLARDALIAGLFVVAGAAELTLRGSFQPREMASALMMTVPLFWRRRAPFASAVLVATGVAITGKTPTDLHLILAALLFAMYSLGAHAPNRMAAAATTVALVLLSTSAAIRSTETAARDIVSIAVVVGTALVVGRVMRDRELRTTASTERAAVLESEREGDLRRAASEERGRIARELHDVIAHGVTVMVVQAGAAEQIIERDPARARQALVAIQHTGRQALTDLRRLLGLVRDDDTLRLAPRPGLQELDALVDEMRKAGVPIEVEIRGTPRDLPAGVDLSAFRILQEALTNVLKHAGEARARVVVAYAPNAIELEVVDDGRVKAHGHGHGLIGMRERVILYGGTLEAGPSQHGGYRVRARLPLDVVT
jgi:signal transduction histidine kinase